MPVLSSTPIFVDMELQVARGLYQPLHSKKLETAENYLAIKAIKYTEQRHHKTPQDYNYAN
jgi:hypothetical protein